MPATADVERDLTFGKAPGALPLLGHGVALLRHPLEFMESLSAHGDLVEIRLAWRRIFVACHPALARTVLTDFRTFDRTGPIYETVRASLGSGLATAPHSDHRRQRLIMQPSFHHSKLPGYADVIREETAAAMRRWQAGNVVDLVQEMFRLTNAVSIRAFFSTDLDAQQADELHEALDVFLRVIYKKTAFSMVGKFGTVANRRFGKAIDDWRGKVRELVETRRRDGGEHDDLMGRLLAARDDKQQPLSDDELSDQVALLLLAGGETTSSAIFWALHLLITHPSVLDAVRREADQVLGGDIAGWEHLTHLRLTARALQEAMRIYPPAWVLPRTCTRDVTLAGHPVRAGSLILFSPLILHRRADLFPSPHTFDPDRWRSGEETPPNRTSFLPFGAGPTKCIGEDLGTMEATLILASIVNRWNIEALTGPDVPLAIRTVLAPASYPVRLKHRDVTATEGAAGPECVI